MPKTRTETGAKEPIVSVVVPCYNSERTIRQCLQAITNQQTSVDFEVIAVDSSTDETPSIIAAEFPQVRLIHLDRRTHAGAARNIGMRESRSPYCLMIDSDCVARPDLIELVVERHNEDSYAAVGGSLRNGTPGSLSGLIGYLLEFKEFMPSTPMRTETNVPTANLCYRREALKSFGGFDEELRLAEDILLNWKISASGERILFDPEIEVTHLNRTGWKTVLTYQIDLGRYSARARARGHLPGAWLLRFPALILLLPIMRTYRALAWLARYDRRLFIVFLLAWPLYLLGTCFWSYGFFLEAKRMVEDFQSARSRPDI
ncbi:MAG TPA: glycosyltransferase [Blastocatellia bacterium]|nr:glycosyltransferase [Blastocatellia bacterium]